MGISAKATGSGQFGHLRVAMRSWANPACCGLSDALWGMCFFFFEIKDVALFACYGVLRRSPMVQALLSLAHVLGVAGRARPM